LDKTSFFFLSFSTFSILTLSYFNEFLRNITGTSLILGVMASFSGSSLLGLMDFLFFKAGLEFGKFLFLSP